MADGTRRIEAEVNLRAIALAASDSHIIRTHQVNALIVGPEEYGNTDRMRALVTTLALRRATDNPAAPSGAYCAVYGPNRTLGRHIFA